MTTIRARSVVAEPVPEAGLRLRPLAVALRYATAMGWAVVPGCDQGRGGRRCGRDDCFTARPHPATGHGELTATRDEHTIYRWWRRGRSAPVLIAVGRSFDILDVPSYAASEALPRLRGLGCRLGPVAITGAGRLLIWINPCTVDDVGSDLDLYHRGEGEYLTAPPARETRWLEPPVPYTHRVLPSAADVVDAMVEVCEQYGAPITSTHHGARAQQVSALWDRRPCRGGWFGGAGA